VKRLVVAALLVATAAHAEESQPDRRRWFGIVVGGGWSAFRGVGTGSVEVVAGVREHRIAALELFARIDVTAESRDYWYDPTGCGYQSIYSTQQPRWMLGGIRQWIYFVSTAQVRFGVAPSVGVGVAHGHFTERAGGCTLADQTATSIALMVGTSLAVDLGASYLAFRIGVELGLRGPLSNGDVIGADLYFGAIMGPLVRF
jgi:hypothetical protein